MHGGAIAQLRQSLQRAQYAPRWQQNLIAAGLLGVGAALVVAGEPIGVVLIVFAIWFVIARLSRRLRS